MTINIIKRPSTDRKKVRYTFEWGRGQGERVKTGLFTYWSFKQQAQVTFLSINDDYNL